MTSQSIYTEYSNLTPEYIQWLDGCGAVWKGIKQKFSDYKPVEEYIYFGIRDGINCFMQGPEDKDDTHIPTGSEFCERVADILEIEKPVFDRGLKDKLVKKLELHDRMERPLPEVEDKGLAIEVKLLSEESREWLVGNVGGASITFSEIYGAPFDPKYIVYTSPNYYPFPQISFSKFADLKDYDLTITTDTEEFMRYVADKTGKERESSEAIISQAIKENYASQVASSYPHRLYRVLDSLDGIPFDKRIPLSEWIPPMGERVCFIYDGGLFYAAEVNAIAEQGLMLTLDNGVHRSDAVHTDGHWMRIV